jgi:hypothetical protein
MCDLKEWYVQLSEKEKGILDQKFDNSPVVTKLIQFLNKNQSNSISNRDIIKYIYVDEYTYENLQKLSNRFAKLKKKVTDSISETIEPASLLMHEEQQFFYARQLVNQQKYKTARNALITLEKHCYALNIFEILPGVIEQRITLEQRTDPLNSKLHQELNARYSEALELQYQIRKVWLLITETYHVGVHATLVKKHLKAVKQISDEFASFPRFKIAYHYGCILRGMDGRYVKKLNALSRHFNAFEKLQKQHPKIPVLHYKPNHDSTIRLYSIPQLKAYYHYSQLDFEMAYQTINQVQIQLENDSSGSIYVVSEGLIMNQITFCIGAERYREALEHVDQLVDFQRKQKKPENKIFTFLFRSAVYVHAYPQLKCNDYANIKQQLDALLLSMRKGKSNTFYNEYHWIYASFLLLNNDHSKALKILRSEACKSFLSSSNHELMHEVFQLKINTAPDKIKSVRLQLSKALFATTRSNEYLAIRWAKKLVDAL